MHRRGFICAGCWTVDRIKMIDLWPAEEELGRILAVERQGGGSAHNVGIDIRKLDPDMPVSTIGLLGEDEEGDLLYRLASSHALDTSQLRRTRDAGTSYTDVMSVQGTGKRTFFHYTGANDLLSPEDFDLDNRPEKILHLGLLSLHERLDAEDGRGGNGWSTVLKKAQSAGLRTSIEMVSIEPLRNRQLVEPCLPYIDYLIVNDREISAIARLPTLVNGKADAAACLQAARLVLAEGNMALVAVHYPEGAVCVMRDGSEYISSSLAMPPELIAGSVGAGDAFVAGFLYGIHEDWSIADSIELAHAAAAACLRAVNTVDGVESIAACRQFAGKLRTGTE